MLGSAKTCSVCGVNVSDKPRTKDATGKYFCEPCAAKAKAAAQPAAPAAPAAKPAAPTPAAKPAAKPGPDVYQVDPLMEKILSQGAPAAPAEGAEPVAPAGPCPACSAAMSPGAAICLVCGYNMKSGKVLKTRVTTEGGGGGGGRKLSLGTNTDWNEVARIAGGILLYFMVCGGLMFVNPLFLLLFAISAMVYGLYYMIAMVVQPFLEGRFIWGMYHTLVLVMNISAGVYARSEGEDTASVVPLVLMLPSIYYIFWLCENNRLKAMWLLSLLGMLVLVVAALVFGIAVAAGGVTPGP